MLAQDFKPYLHLVVGRVQGFSRYWFLLLIDCVREQHSFHIWTNCQSTHRYISLFHIKSRAHRQDDTEITLSTVSGYVTNWYKRFRSIGNFRQAIAANLSTLDLFTSVRMDAAIPATNKNTTFKSIVFDVIDGLHSAHCTPTQCSQRIPHFFVLRSTKWVCQQNTEKLLVLAHNQGDYVRRCISAFNWHTHCWCSSLQLPPSLTRTVHSISDTLNSDGTDCHESTSSLNQLALWKKKL